MAQESAIEPVEAPENSLVPHIFFSYARADWDRYLERFFADLGRRTAQAMGLGDATIFFLDTGSIESGEDWNKKIAAALQVSKVLVCVYSPNFFSKSAAHTYCAKEFDAFLRRQPELRYEEVLERGNPTVQVRDVRNIVPILWLGERDLTDQGLPPSIVRTITYSLNKAKQRLTSEVSDAYQSKGMEQITRRRGTTYGEILAAVAGLIRDYAGDPPPPMAEPPEFATLRNVFWDPPLRTAAGAAPLKSPTAEQSITEPAGPRRLLSIEVRVAGSGDPPWAPFVGDQSLADMVVQIANERRMVNTALRFDPDAPEFLSQVQATLDAATAANTISVLFVDPRSLGSERSRSILETLLRGTWRGGVLFPVDIADREVSAIVERAGSFFQTISEQEQRLAIRKVIGSAKDFRGSVIVLLDDIAARIFKHGDVQRTSPDNAGPAKRPTITNTPPVAALT